MTDRFRIALAHVLKHEGGFVNDPADPGGATNHGITIKTLAAARGESVTVQDVRDLSRDEAETIYRERYWTPCRCDELPPALDLMVFDCAVNQGPGRAIRFLQEAVGVRADGVIGPVTLKAARDSEPGAAECEYAARRMVHYGSLSTFSRFGLGWSRRMMDTLRAAL